MADNTKETKDPLAGILSRLSANADVTLGPGEPVVPTERALREAETNMQILQLAQANMTYIDIAKNLGLSLREVVDRGARVDLAFLSVGELTHSNTMSRVGLITRTDVEELLQAGAAGDICAHWINDEGGLVDHPLNSRVVALPPDRLREIPCVMIASGGKAKTPVLRGVLKGGMADVVITDEQTAKAVLAMEGA